MKKFRVAIVVGTRPEAIKMAPVIQALSNSKTILPVTVTTSQHKEMVRQIFHSFGIKAAYDLDVMRREQKLWDLSGRLVSELGRLFDKQPMDAVLVQGDTSTAFFGGLSAFYHKIPVGHVEAGLRTGNIYAPFPEEMNRKLLSSVASWHFAPTERAAKQLRREVVPWGSIHVTGNTVVDALRWMAPRCTEGPLKKLIGAERMEKKLILVTCHRRESLGEPMQHVAEALAMIARTNKDSVTVFPLHPNPAVRSLIKPVLEKIPNVVLCEPLDYEQFLSCLKHSHLVISDSGGVQEEATALGKPVLVLRTETERQEGVSAGALKLVGTHTQRIVREGQRLLRDERAYQRMSRASDVFGDGQAARRIVGILEAALEEGVQQPPQRLLEAA